MRNFLYDLRLRPDKLWNVGKIWKLGENIA